MGKPYSMNLRERVVAHADFILGVLANAPDTTPDEMVELLREERGVTVVRAAVWKLLDRRGQIIKKDCPCQ